MGELKEILIFCGLYSGVMLGALAYTLSLQSSPVRIPRQKGFEL